MESRSHQDPLLVRSSRVLLPAAGGGHAIAPASILIGDGRISEVRTGASLPLPPDVAVLDYGDDLIAPAFVNPHTHLAMNFMRGRLGDQAASDNPVEQIYFRIETQLEAGDVRAFTRMGAYESLLAGVGLVWDHYYFGEAVAAGLRDVGLCGVVAPTLQDVHGPGVARLQHGLDETLRIAGDAAMAQDGLFAALGPHATDSVSPALWSRLSALSEQHGLPLHFHLAQSTDEVLRAQRSAGGSPVELLRRTGVLDGTQPLVLAHGIFLSIADAQVVTGPRRRLIACPASQMQFALPARVDRWAAAGIPFLVGTDAGNCNDGLALQKELRLIAASRTLPAGFSAAMEALLAGGGGPAAEAVARERDQVVRALAQLGNPDALLRLILDDAGAMHPRFSAGVIAPGALANLALWQLDSPAFWPASDPLRGLAFGDLGPALRQLIVLGRPRLADAAAHATLLTSPEYRDARSEADRRLALLCARAGI